MKKKYKNIKKKINNYKYRFKIFVNHEDTKRVKNNILIGLVRFTGMIIFSVFVLFILRLFNYELTFLNLVSAFSLLMIVEEIPEWVKRCRK